MIVSVAVLAAMTGASAALASGWRTYTDPEGRWSIQYPAGWRVDTAHVYSALGPGKEIHGVAFVVPENFTRGTNLRDDSYLAIETLPAAQNCAPGEFLDNAIDRPRTKFGNNGIAWSIQDGADAGAGNFYEETVQAAVGSKPCIATRAFAHSTNVANYDPGTVKAFDRRAFNIIMDRMRSSFRFLR